MLSYIQKLPSKSLDKLQLHFKEVSYNYLSDFVILQ